MTAANALPLWLDRWRLAPDGPAFSTRFGSRLMPVIFEGEPAMLKIAGGEEEQRGGALMAWWAGVGAARVLARDGEAILLERVVGPASLEAMAHDDGGDETAAAILCQVAAGLHAPRSEPPPQSLVPLPIWFRQLEPAAAAHGGAFVAAAAAARELLASPREVVVLHGDFHHGNVLDGGSRGWLAIDPKGLIGERGFEFANLFRNPDAELALAPGRMRRLVELVAQLANLEPVRLINWILAYAGLGAAWSLDSGHEADARTGLAIAEIAAAQLGSAAR